MTWSPYELGSDWINMSKLENYSFKWAGLSSLAHRDLIALAIMGVGRIILADVQGRNCLGSFMRASVCFSDCVFS